MIGSTKLFAGYTLKMWQCVKRLRVFMVKSLFQSKFHKFYAEKLGRDSFQRGSDVKIVQVRKKCLKLILDIFFRLVHFSFFSRSEKDSKARVKHWGVAV